MVYRSCRYGGVLLPIRNSMRRRVALLIFLLLAGIIAVPLLLTWREVRQERLNHALIKAVDQDDVVAIRQWLHEGADSDAAVLPEDNRPFWKRLSDLLRHTLHPAPTAYGSALLEAIRGYYPGFRDSDLDAKHYQIIQALVDSGANVNARVIGAPEDGRWYPHQRPRTTALIEAASHSDWIAMQTLLDHHAQVNAADDFGDTALMYTVQGWGRGGEAMVKQLLERGAQVNAQDDQGATALIWIFDDDEEFRHGITPFSRAGSISGSWKGTVALLLKYGADVNHAVKGGQTALHYVVDRYVDKAMVGQLLAAGANPNVADARGDTPLSLVKSQDDPAIMALLKQAGAK
jgi:ankyrin repeat protein